MSTIRMGAATIAAAALFSIAFGGATGTAAEAPKAAGKPVIFNLFGKGLVEPETIFLTANSGPYITDLEWSRWGKDGADGTGTYISDCASCPPPDQREASIELRRSKNCKKTGGRVFRTFRLTTGADYTGEPKTVDVYTGHDLYCKKKKD